MLSFFFFTTEFNFDIRDYSLMSQANDVWDTQCILNPVQKLT
jgi:hypothetical protein